MLDKNNKCETFKQKIDSLKQAKSTLKTEI